MAPVVEFKPQYQEREKERERKETFYTLIGYDLTPAIA
jgi:hypothetical protein